MAWCYLKEMKNKAITLILIVASLVLLALSGCNGGSVSISATVSLIPKAQLDRSAQISSFKAEYGDFDELNADSNFSFQVVVTDSIGEPHELSVYFVHTGELAWQARLYAPPGETAGTVSGPILLAETDILFNADGSVFVAAAGGRTIYPNLTAEPVFSNGAPPTSFTISLSQVTEVDGASELLSISEVRS